MPRNPDNWGVLASPPATLTRYRQWRDRGMEADYPRKCSDLELVDWAQKLTFS